MSQGRFGAPARIIAFAAAALCAGSGWRAAASEASSGQSDLVRGNNEFALALYARLAAGKEDNVFFSPYSISAALAMAYAGAKGQTARQMAEVLRFSPRIQSLPEAFKEIDDGLNARGRGGKVKLVVANALWGQKGCGFKRDFLGVAGRYYGGTLRELDFRADAGNAAAVINAWIEKKTAGKITGLIAPGVLNARTRLVLTDAVYFRGAWLSPFEKSRTRDMAFDAASGRQVQAPFMSQTGPFGYAQTGALQALRLPYAGGLSFVVLLPREAGGLAAMEKNLTWENLNGLLSALSERQVEVYLPKFKAASGFDLAAALKSLGMADAFSPPRPPLKPGQADFSGMDGKRDLWISGVIHKAFISLDEKGTQAAAATAVVMMRATAVMRREPAVVFRADHPFVFLVQDDASGSILFLGQLANPAR